MNHPLPPTSALPTPQLTNSACSRPQTSVNDLTQFLIRSSLSTSRRRTSYSSIDAQLSDPVPVPVPALTSRHHPRHHHSHHHVSRRGRTPSCRSYSSSSARSSRQISRVASLVDTLVSSSSTSSDSDAYHFSSTSAATSPSPSLSPDDSSAIATSYFDLDYRPSSSSSSLDGGGGGGRGGRRRGGGMPVIPDTEDMCSRNQQSPMSRARDGVGVISSAVGRRAERVMKPIKMRRRRGEKRKGKSGGENEE